MEARIAQRMGVLVQAAELLSSNSQKNTNPKFVPPVAASTAPLTNLAEYWVRDETTMARPVETLYNDSRLRRSHRLARLNSPRDHQPTQSNKIPAKRSSKRLKVAGIPVAERHNNSTHGSRKEKGGEKTRKQQMEVPQKENFDKELPLHTDPTSYEQNANRQLDYFEASPESSTTIFDMYKAKSRKTKRSNARNISAKNLQSPSPKKSNRCREESPRDISSPPSVHKRSITDDPGSIERDVSRCLITLSNEQLTSVEKDRSKRYTPPKDENTSHPPKSSPRMHYLDTMRGKIDQEFPREASPEAIHSVSLLDDDQVDQIIPFLHIPSFQRALQDMSPNHTMISSPCHTIAGAPHTTEQASEHALDDSFHGFPKAPFFLSTPTTKSNAAKKMILLPELSKTLVDSYYQTSTYTSDKSASLALLYHESFEDEKRESDAFIASLLSDDFMASPAASKATDAFVASGTIGSDQKLPPNPPPVPPRPEPETAPEKDRLGFAPIDSNVSNIVSAAATSKVSQERQMAVVTPTDYNLQLMNADDIYSLSGSENGYDELLECMGHAFSKPS